MTETTPQDEQDEIDPAVHMTKHMAYSRAETRLHRKVTIISFIIALPAFLFTWQSGVHQYLFALIDMPEVANPELLVLVMRATPAMLVWAIVVALLYPLRAYLRNRWAVDPERYGLDTSSGGKDG